jgi:hypothetical protein
MTKQSDVECRHSLCYQGSLAESVGPADTEATMAAEAPVSTYQSRDSISSLEMHPAQPWLSGAWCQGFQAAWPSIL